VLSALHVTADTKGILRTFPLNMQQCPLFSAASAWLSSDGQPLTCLLVIPGPPPPPQLLPLPTQKMPLYLHPLSQSVLWMLNYEMRSCLGADFRGALTRQIFEWGAGEIVDTRHVDTFRPQKPTFIDRVSAGFRSR